MSTKESDLTKVSFVQKDDEDNPLIENMWATDLGGNVYRLQNCPFYVYGLSLEDEFEATMVDGQSRPVFMRTLRKSGNRTFRVVFDEPITSEIASTGFLERLRVLGCGYEGMTATRFAINVPPSVRLSDVVDILIKSNVLWEPADPEYDECFPN